MLNRGAMTAIAGVIGVFAYPTTSAFAQAADAAGSGQVEEIVVTAQRRDQRLQDVPVAVNVLTSSALASRGLSDAGDLSAAVPGLTFATQGAAGTPFLRGVGSGSGNPSDEQSVATYIDGVYIAAPFGNIFNFNSIERIEVLKGPQGTLFGRNATGGVVQLITRDPSQEPAFEATAGYANYDTKSGSAYITGGLTDNIAVNLAGQFEDQGKGYGRSLTTGAETYKHQDYSVRGKVLFEPTDATRFLLSSDYSESDGTGLDYQMPRGVAGIDGNTDYPGRYNIRNNFPNGMPRKTYGGSLRIDQDLGFARLVSITAQRRAQVDYSVDADATPVAGTNAVLYQRQKNISQEVHLVSPEGSKVDWLLGAFYYDSNAGQVARISGASAGGLPYLDINGFMKTKSASAFAQATVEVMPDTKLTGGIRYTDEKQKLVAGINMPTGPLVPEITPNPEQTTKKATWRIALDHNFTSDILGYVSYNRGTKSGGFDILSFNSFKPEILDAYEVGLKTEFFDRRLRLNVSGFWYDYKDIQVQIVRVVGAQTLNAAAAEIKGIDVDFEAVPVRNLTLSGGFAYTHGEYTDYTDATTYPASPGPAITFDATGNRTIRTPKITGSLNADYRVPTSVGDVTLSGSVVYNGKFYWGAENRLTEPAYTLLNASVLWTSTDERYNFRIWGQNLADEQHFAQRVVSGNGDIQVQAAPRTYGATLGVKF